jgi:hypothetical protein
LREAVKLLVAVRDHRWGIRIEGGAAITGVHRRASEIERIDLRNRAVAQRNAEDHRHQAADAERDQSRRSRHAASNVTHRARFRRKMDNGGQAQSPR